MTREIQYRVLKDAGEPPKRGRRGKWTNLPLAVLEPNSRIDVTMTDAEANEQISAVRSYASRVAKKTGYTFSVVTTDSGISIMRVT